MTRRQVFFLVLGVIAFHLGLFWFLGGSIRPLPPRRFPLPPQDDLRIREASFTHPESGEELVYREIRVSTKLAFPDALMKQSSNPAAVAPTSAPADDTLISYEPE